MGGKNQKKHPCCDDNKDYTFTVYTEKMASVLQFLFWLWNFMLLLLYRIDGTGEQIQSGEQELAFFCSHAEGHGLHTAHTAPRLSIHQIQKYPNAVCAVFVRVILCANMIKCWLQQRRPVETCRSWLKDGDVRMLRKASGGGEKEEVIWLTTGKWGNAEGRRLCENCCGGFLSHRAAGAESGWSTGECWPRWSSNFLSVVCVGFAPAERHPETQLLALSEARAVR